MIRIFVVVLGASLFALSPARAQAPAPDAAAGKAKAEEVCAACHGANGVSVGAAIPNLAGQKSAYLAAQLRDFAAGKRKHDMMTPIAKQLSAADIANVAAHFAGLPGAAAGTAMSSFLPHVAKSNVKFPADYKKTFTEYMRLNFPDRNQVRLYYANPAAVKAAREGKPMPNGSMFFVEVYAPKLDDAKKPVMGGDGFFVPDKLLFYTSMAMEAGWGKDIPEILRNGDWNYAVFNLDMTQRAAANQAECLACHKPFANDSYLFTLKQLAAAAKK
jgi:cytochrome c553